MCETTCLEVQNEDIKDIARIFFERSNEINLMLELLKQGDIRAINVEKAPIIKAAIVLMIYNEIECITTELIRALFNIIVENEVCIHNLNQKLKETFSEYYVKIINSRESVENKRKTFLEILDKKDEPLRISFEEYARYKSLYSGNLDCAKIREVFENLGLKKCMSLYHEDNSKPIQQIKILRNRLAHGEVSFSEAGRSKVIGDIQKMYKAMHIVLKEMILLMDEYIVSRKYRCAVEVDEEIS